MLSKQAAGRCQRGPGVLLSEPTPEPAPPSPPTPRSVCRWKRLALEAGHSHSHNRLFL